MTRLDPTRTTDLRRRFASEVRGGYKALAAEVRRLVDAEDAFGLRAPTVNEARAWLGLPGDLKLARFGEWLRGAMARLLLAGSVVEQFITMAFRRGSTRSASDTGRMRGVDQLAAREVVAGSIGTVKAKLLAARAVMELDGVNERMAAAMTRTLADGLVGGWTPRQIAAEMNKETGIGLARALTVTRTELVRAHAEGQLDAMARLGVERVGALVEWSTAGDHRVCSRCADLEGQTFTLDEAAGLIPVHANCRCAWVPASGRG